jgi:multidrug efflux system outer membrane protein
MLTLVSSIAASYFSLLEFDRELEIAKDSRDTYRQTLDLFTSRFRAGRDSKLGVTRAQAAYDSSSASIASLSRAIAQQENALSVLLGAYPKAIDRGTALTQQVTPEIPLGLTTDVLKRRPDIQQAEQVMIGANAEVGVAVANFYPTIGLGALFGGQSPAVDDMFKSEFGIWSIGAGIAGPIFQGGRLKSAYQAQQAFWDQTIAQYKEVVIAAFRETSDALIARQTLVDQRTAIQSQVAALREAMDVATQRYTAGRASYFEVLEAQQQLFPAESALAQTQRDQLLAVVNLYKALGGGWNLNDSQWAQPP